MKKACIKVALALPVHDTFDYTIPDHLIDYPLEGCRVLVPFRNRQVTGYVLGRLDVEERPGLKDIIKVLDRGPLFHQKMVPFFEWMAHYYMYPLGRFIQSALPGGLNRTSYPTAKITPGGISALRYLADDSEEKKILAWVEAHPGKRLPFHNRAIHSLQKKGWLVVENKITKRSAGPLIKKFVRPMKGADLHAIISHQAETLCAGGERQFLETILQAGCMMLRELSFKFPNGSYLVKKWIKKGVLECYEAPVVRSPIGKLMLPSPIPRKLYEQQESVLSVIGPHLVERQFSTFLLYGVTGSGKTEVYYRAVQKAVELGRQAIMLVPEIALAVYMEGIFVSRMGQRVAVYHSALSAGERYDQWIRMVNGEVDLVIGARSALFAPLPDLGLIIVDEEHDFSYKQGEGPRYQARDAAVVRGKMENALVILGSGTPSIQSYHNSLNGRYRLITMPDRIEKRPLPQIETTDMKAVPEEHGLNTILSPILKQALEKNIERGKQAILFLNRRGFDRVYLCRLCGQSIRCLNCDLALIYHLEEQRLSCHYCGFRAAPDKTCPSCGKKGLRAYGFGTEKLEQELKALYPETRIARLDRDSTRQKDQIFNVLKRFISHDIDILVGTQMITKGYDFPDVTLVGVIAADVSLGFPDFRASERTFQLLSQVAGRAGRGDDGGRVIIQTFNPDHYAITAAKAHDYVSFFQREKALREQLGYPPFSYLACFRLQGNNQENTANMAGKVGQCMRDILDRWPKRGREIQVLGPAEAPLSKIRGKYRWQIFVKSRGAALLHQFIRRVGAATNRFFNSSGVAMSIDIDPYQML